MPTWVRRSLIPTLIMAAMLATLAVLGYLQYGWSVQIADALQQRMRAGLVSSVGRFQTELQRDLSRLCVTFEIPTARSRAQMRTLLGERANEWQRPGVPQALVRRVYAVEADARGDWRAESLDIASGRYAAEPWPAAWPQLARALSSNSEELHDATPGQWRSRPWNLDPEARVLFRAVASESTVPGEDTQYSLLAYVVVELDTAYLEHEYLPDLAQRCFTGDQEFRVVVQSAGVRLYDSQAGFQPLEADSADAVADLLAPRRRPPPAPRSAQRSRPVAAAPERARIEPAAIRIAGTGGFRLLARHRTGSLQAAVQQWRRRNLATGFGVLLILGGGMAFLAVYAYRARRLAQLQIDFVANISHELRTPVAATCMIADNLADGVTDDPARIRNYGRMLRVQGSRLRQMVDQVLMFAGNQKRAARPNLTPTSVAETVAAAVAQQAHMIQAAGMTLEQSLPDDLPAALADPPLLETCLANLLDNAVKYGRSGSWIGLRAEATPGPKREIRISVEDHGPGIEAADRPHIFDAFYRGRIARDTQAPGAGLGLSLVRQAMQSMGGHVSVENPPDQGARFTLHLPACETGIVEKRQAAGADGP